MSLQKMLDRIDKTKEYIATRRPLLPEEVKQLDEYFKIGLTYTSNALEGNSLTLSETAVILKDGITVGGKPLRDIYEAVGHADAYNFMIEAARSDFFNLSADIIRQLHKLFYQGVDAKHAGVYRDIQNYIQGSEHIPPKAEDVPALMNSFIHSFDYRSDNTHPVKLAAYAHQKFVDIHPFIDGNGRTARLIMNLILINHGYQIISIPPILRAEYISALEASRRGGNAFTTFIAELEIEAQKEFCRMLHIEYE